MTFKHKNLAMAKVASEFFFWSLKYFPGHKLVIDGLKVIYNQTLWHNPKSFAKVSVTGFKVELMKKLWFWP